MTDELERLRQQQSIAQSRLDDLLNQRERAFEGCGPCPRPADIDRARAMVETASAIVRTAERTADDAKLKHLDLAKKLWDWRRGLITARLPGSAYILALVLSDVFLNKTSGKLNPSPKRLMRASGLPERTVRFGLSKLIENCLLIEDDRDFFLALPGKILPVNQTDDAARNCRSEQQDIAAETGKKLPPIEHVEEEPRKREHVMTGGAGSGAYGPCLPSVANFASCSEPSTRDDDLERKAS